MMRFRNTHLPLMVSLFAAGAVLFTSVSASAATKVPLGGSKEDCIVQQTALNDVAVLKDYGKLRVDNRNKYLDTRYSDDKISKKYDALDTSFDKASSELKTKLKKDVSVSKPKNHKQVLIDDRNTIKKLLVDKQTALDNPAATPATLATANCEIIWDLRVASYVLPKLNNQYVLDSLANKNAITQVYYQYAKENNKSTGLKDPADLNTRITALQDKLDLIKVGTTAPANTDAFNPEKTKSSEAFKTQLADLPQLKKDITSASSNTKSAARSAAAKNKKKKAPTKPASTSTSSDSSSSSGSSSFGGSSGSTASSPTPAASSQGKTEKQKAADKKKADKIAKDIAKKKKADNKKIAISAARTKSMCTEIAKSLNKNKNKNQAESWEIRSCTSGVKLGTADFKKEKKTPKACYINNPKPDVEFVCNQGYAAAISFLGDKYGARNIK